MIRKRGKERECVFVVEWVETSGSERGTKRQREEGEKKEGVRKEGGKRGKDDACVCVCACSLFSFIMLPYFIIDAPDTEKVWNAELEKVNELLSIEPESKCRHSNIWMRTKGELHYEAIKR